MDRFRKALGKPKNVADNKGKDQIAAKGKGPAAAKAKNPTNPRGPNQTDPRERKKIEPKEKKIGLEDFEIEEKEFGKGNFSAVYKARVKESNKDPRLNGMRNKDLAIKILGRGNFGSEINPDVISQELFAVKNIPKSPGLVTPYTYFHTDKRELCLVYEFLSGGELYDVLKKQRKRRKVFQKSERAAIVKNLAIGLKALHDLNILHRDLKAENFFFSEEKPLDVKIGDYGLVHKITNHHPEPDESGGTPECIAPEVCFKIIDGGKRRKFKGFKDFPLSTYQKSIMTHGTKATDVWMLGIACYEMIAGEPYPEGDLYKLVTEFIPQRKLTKKIEDLDIEPEEKHLLDGMLTVDPGARMTIDDVVAHPWLNGRKPDENISTNTLAQVPQRSQDITTMQNPLPIRSPVPSAQNTVAAQGALNRVSTAGGGRRHSYMGRDIGFRQNQGLPPVHHANRQISSSLQPSDSRQNAQISTRSGIGGGAPRRQSTAVTSMPRRSSFAVASPVMTHSTTLKTVRPSVNNNNYITEPTQIQRSATGQPKKPKRGANVPPR